LPNQNFNKMNLNKMNLPIAGKYRFTQPFSISYCAQYAGSTGIVNPCVRTETISFSVGDVINSSGGSWDDNSQSLQVIFVAPNGQNMPVPVSKVVKVADTTPLHISNTNTSSARLHISNTNTSSASNGFASIPTPVKVIGVLAGISLVIVAIKFWK